MSKLPPAPTPTPAPAPDAADDVVVGGCGRLTATILSAYDLPEGAEPISVRLTVDGLSVSTGPPRSRKKDRNSYRFVANESDGQNDGTNELVIQAPLSRLYDSAAKFEVVCEGGGPTLNCEIESLSSAVVVNETKWLVLNLSSPTDQTKKDDDDKATVPTLRLRLLMEGDYRPEIGFLVNAAAAYFRTVDGVADAVSSSAKSLTKAVPANALSSLTSVPVVPAAAGLVALSPVLLGAAVVGAPLLVPMIVLASVVGVATASVSLGLYLSASEGRSRVADAVAPLFQTLLSTTTGQRAVYDTGPRPTPVETVRLVLPDRDDVVGTLVLSLAIDAVGSSSYLLPVVGELTDVWWAPAQTLLVAAMYDDDAPSLKYVSFVEEALPFSDFVPTATLGWCKRFAPAYYEAAVRKGSLF